MRTVLIWEGDALIPDTNSRIQVLLINSNTDTTVNRCVPENEYWHVRETPSMITARENILFDAGQW